METKNVIAAISLSAAVIILYSLFFAPPPPDQSKIQKLKSAIHYYLSELGEEKDVRLDISSVIIGKNPIMKIYQGVILD